jgi:hypothetical protein
MLAGQRNRPLAIFLLVVGLATLALAMSTGSIWLGAGAGGWGAAAYMWWRGTPRSRR